MDCKLLNRKLRDRARSLGLCDEWFGKWKGSESEQELIDKYKRGIDFCIENDFPNSRFIKANFSRERLLKNLIFVDEKIDIVGENGIYILNGETTGTIRFDGYSVATVYVRHGCNINIECFGNAKVFVSLFNDAALRVTQSGTAKCYVYQKSAAASLSTIGDVMVRKQKSRVD